VAIFIRNFCGFIQQGRARNQGKMNVKNIYEYQQYPEKEKTGQGCPVLNAQEKSQSS
jgi:hypothetical protein